MPANVKGFGCRPSRGPNGPHRGRRPKVSSEGTRERWGVGGAASALWGFGDRVWDRSDANLSRTGGCGDRLTILPVLQSRPEGSQAGDEGLRCCVWACRSGAGSGPAGIGRRQGGNGCSGHEVSILIGAGRGDGRCRGVSPRSKTSMMRMRLPQHGQGGVGVAASAAET